MIEQDNSLTRQMQQDIAKLVELQEQQLSEDRLDRMKSVTDASFAGPAQADYLSAGGVHYSSAMAADQTMYAAQAASTSFAGQVNSSDVAYAMQHSPYSMNMADYPESFQRSYANFQKEMTGVKDLSGLFDMSAYRRRSFEDQGLMFNQYGHRLSNAALAGTGAVANFAGFAAGSGVWSALGGGAISGMAVGVGAGAVAGYYVGEVAEELKRRQQASDFLFKESYRFIDKYESENRRYGVGFSDEQRRQASRAISEISKDSMIDFDETMDMLSSFTEMGALRSVSDVESFSNQFSKLVKAVKSSAISLNSSYEEVQDFMADMKKQGIDISNFDVLSAQMKVAAGYLGTSGTGMMNTSADLVYGMSRKDLMFDQTLGLQDIAYTTQQLSGVFNKIEAGDADIANRIKILTNNMGGREEVIKTFHSGAASSLSGEFFDFFAGALREDKSGRAYLDPDIIEQFAYNQLSLGDLLDMGRNADPELVRKARLNSLAITQESILQKGWAIPILGNILTGQKEMLGTPEMLFSDLMSMMMDPNMQELAQFGPLIEEVFKIDAEEATKGVATQKREVTDKVVEAYEKSMMKSPLEKISKTLKDWTYSALGIEDVVSSFHKSEDQIAEILERVAFGGTDYSKVLFTMEDIGYEARKPLRDEISKLVEDDMKYIEFSSLAYGQMKKDLEAEIYETDLFLSGKYVPGKGYNLIKEDGTTASQSDLKKRKAELEKSLENLTPLIEGMDSMFLQEMSASMGVLSRLQVEDREAMKIFTEAKDKIEKGTLRFDQGEEYVDKIKKAMMAKIGEASEDQLVSALGGADVVKELGINLDMMRERDKERVFEVLSGLDPEYIENRGVSSRREFEAEALKMESVVEVARESNGKLMDAVLDMASDWDRSADTIRNKSVVRTRTDLWAVR